MTSVALGVERLGERVTVDEWNGQEVVRWQMATVDFSRAPRPTSALHWVVDPSSSLTLEERERRAKLMDALDREAGRRMASIMQWLVENQRRVLAEGHLIAPEDLTPE